MTIKFLKDDFFDNGRFITSKDHGNHLQKVLASLFDEVNDLVGIPGATPPLGLGVEGAGAWEFDADAEQMNLKFKVPAWWESEDITLQFAWFGDTQISDTETVEWDWTYTSFPEPVQGQDLDSTTPTTGTVTHVQSGAGVDKEIIFKKFNCHFLYVIRSV